MKQGVEVRSNGDLILKLKYPSGYCMYRRYIKQDDGSFVQSPNGPWDYLNNARKDDGSVNKPNAVEVGSETKVHDETMITMPQMASQLDISEAIARYTGEEADPNGLDAHEPGAKLDAGKLQADILEEFHYALEAIAKVGTYGAKKYSRGGWLQVPDAISRYRAAEWRHKLDGQLEELDPGSGLPHLWHHAWNVMAVLHLIIKEQKERENDG